MGRSRPSEPGFSSRLKPAIELDQRSLMVRDSGPVSLALGSQRSVLCGGAHS
jgi:hypothetical protein